MGDVITFTPKKSALVPSIEVGIDSDMLMYYESTAKRATTHGITALPLEFSDFLSMYFKEIYADSDTHTEQDLDFIGYILNYPDEYFSQYLDGLLPAINETIDRREEKRKPRLVLV